MTFRACVRSCSSRSPWWCCSSPRCRTTGSGVFAPTGTRAPTVWLLVVAFALVIAGFGPVAGHDGQPGPAVAADPAGAGQHQLPAVGIGQVDDGVLHGGRVCQSRAGPEAVLETVSAAVRPDRACLWPDCHRGFRHRRLHSPDQLHHADHCRRQVVARPDAVARWRRWSHRRSDSGAAPDAAVGGLSAPGVVWRVGGLPGQPVLDRDWLGRPVGQRARPGHLQVWPSAGRLHRLHFRHRGRGAWASWGRSESLPCSFSSLSLG